MIQLPLDVHRHFRWVHTFTQLSLAIYHPGHGSKAFEWNTVI